MKNISIIIVTIIISFTVQAKKLTIYTYDSFVSEWGPGPIIKNKFEEKFNTEIEFYATDSAATLLNKIILEGENTKADIVLMIEDVAGTATLNTDIKAYISRNGSAFTSAVTLVNEASWGANKKVLTAHDVDISGITAGTSMKWKIETLNQSATKRTSIHAVSLGWK